MTPLGETPAAAPGAPDASVPLVLVVDDDEDVGGFVVRSLEQAGLRAVLANDGRRAMDLAEAEPPDLVVTGLMMPGIDGFELILLLRKHPDQRLARVPIVVLTRRAQDEHRARAIGIGASWYLTKPVDADELLSAVRILLGGG